MQKSLICGLIVSAVVVLVGCQSKNAPSGAKRVTFEVLGLDVSAEAMAPGRVVADDITPTAAGITDIWVIEGTTLLAHQVNTDADFGSPSISLDYGEHSLAFICSGQQGQVVSQGVWSAQNVKESFAAQVSLTVSATTDAQAVVAQRACYGLKWQSLDAVPDGVASLKVEVAQYRGALNAMLQGVSPANKEWSYNIAYRVGSTISVTVSGFPEENAASSDVSTTISFLSADGEVLYQWQKTVPVWANRTTKISGNLFSGHAEAPLSVRTDWGEEYEVSL